MAAGVLPEPGTQFGPCLIVCRHIDCAQTRAMAESYCTICIKRIGYDKRFYNGDQPNTWDHAVCLEDKIEAENNRHIEKVERRKDPRDKAPSIFDRE